MNRMRLARGAMIVLTMIVMDVTGTLAPVLAADDSDVQPVDSEVKALSGMSVLGNNEAPKSLVIVPWKSSELGDGLGIENLLDERARPVDKEVFERELSYYLLRTNSNSE